MQNPVIIFGANAVGRLAKEIFEQNEVVVYGFLDDDKNLHGKEIDEITVLGSTDDDGFLKLIGKKCESFVASDDNRLRKTITKMLNERRHVQPVNAIHKRAFLASKGEMGHGNFVDTGVITSVGVKIGHHNILNAAVVLGVNAQLGDYVQIGTGTNIGHEVVIEDEVFIGSGVTIVSGVKIGKGARVGAGSVVVASINAGETVFGNPAQKVKS
ncbi:MAG TPA: NeuD/PglB/VioB family sugar acetyltransferase [Cyclobacteriaceae bacterium]|nr:NeuD/PglB/VioB family sugar acetyltransferase [Cyclobacteriaceae bacterium]